MYFLRFFILDLPHTPGYLSTDNFFLISIEIAFPTKYDTSKTSGKYAECLPGAGFAQVTPNAL